MEPVISLMIVGNNQFMVEMLLEAFKNYYDINVIGVTKCNLKAVDLVKKLKPHIILLDVIEPGIKEIRILKEFSNIKKENRPLIMILSEQGNNEKIKTVITLGAKEYLIKPLGTDLLVSRIRQVFIEHYYVKKPKPFRNSEIAKEIDTITTELLYDIGILPHLLGYKYIKKAISHIANALDPKVLKPLNKVLYPLIAEEFETTSIRVEGAIRNAIKSAWGKNIYLDKNTIRENSILKTFDKMPTNCQLILALIDLVRNNIGNDDLQK